MQRTKRFLAVAMVASALCADRVAIAAPALRPHMVEAARLMANRLASGLRTSVAAVRLARVIRDVRIVALVRLPRVESVASLHPTQSLPLKFRLPPPAFA